VAGAYLAKPGDSTVVLEARHKTAAPPLAERLRRIALDAGTAVCGGNGMGFFNLEHSLRVCGPAGGAVPPDHLGGGRPAVTGRWGQPWTRSPVCLRNCCTPAARHTAAASASTASDQAMLAAQPRTTSVRIASMA
jgi:hypothetical protein